MDPLLAMTPKCENSHSPLAKHNASGRRRLGAKAVIARLAAAIVVERNDERAVCGPRPMALKSHDVASSVVLSGLPFTSLSARAFGPKVAEVACGATRNHRRLRHVRRLREPKAEPNYGACPGVR